MSSASILKNGIFKENPVFVQVLGMCPVLAITTSVVNGLGMGLSTAAVLLFSNLFISLTRGFVPLKARIPAYIVIIAGFVTVTELLLRAYLPDLYAALGLFIPLIVVNCIILARAESFAAKNTPVRAMLDGLGMGLGFTLALVIIGAAREILGSGTLLAGTGLALSLPEDFPRTVLMVLPPGAFFTLGLLMAFRNHIFNKKARVAGEHNCGISGCGACK